MGDTDKGYLVDYLKDNFELGEYNKAWERVTEDTFEVGEAIGELLSSVGELVKVVVHLFQAGMVSLKNETLEHMPVFFLGAGVAAAALFTIQKATKKNETERMNIKEETYDEEEFYNFE